MPTGEEEEEGGRQKMAVVLCTRHGGRAREGIACSLAYNHRSTTVTLYISSNSRSSSRRGCRFWRHPMTTTNEEEVAGFHSTPGSQHILPL